MKTLKSVFLNVQTKKINNSKITFTKLVLVSLFFLSFCSGSFAQSIDWIVEPIITDAEYIDLALSKQSGNLNLVKIRNGKSWGMKNIKNETLAPCEFRGAQIWSTGKYFDMMDGKVQRYFDTEGYEVDKVEVKAYQKTITEKGDFKKSQKKLKTLNETYDWLEFSTKKSKYGYDYIALNKETKDTISSRMYEKQFHVADSKYSMVKNHNTKFFELKDSKGKVLKSFDDKRYVEEVRSNRFLVRLDKLRGIMDDKGNDILPIQYKRVKFVTDEYISVTKDDKMYELRGLDGNLIPGAKGENIYKSKIDNKIFIKVSKYKTNVLDPITKKITKYDFKTTGKIMGEGIYIVTNKDTLSGLYDLANDIEVVPLKYRRAKREGSLILFGNYHVRKKDRFRSIMRYRTLMNIKGEIILKDSISSISIIDNQLIYIKGANNSCSLYDMAGKKIKDLAENTVLSLSKNSKYFSLFEKGSKSKNYLTVTDYLAGNEKNSYPSVAEKKYTKDKSTWYSIVRKDKKIGVINSNGELIIPIKLEEFDFGYYSKQFLPAKYDGKWGVIANPLFARD